MAIIALQKLYLICFTLRPNASHNKTRVPSVNRKPTRGGLADSIQINRYRLNKVLNFHISRFRCFTNK